MDLLLRSPINLIPQTCFPILHYICIFRRIHTHNKSHSLVGPPLSNTFYDPRFMIAFSCYKLCRYDAIWLEIEVTGRHGESRRYFNPRNLWFDLWPRIKIHSRDVHSTYAGIIQHWGFIYGEKYIRSSRWIYHTES